MKDMEQKKREIFISYSRDDKKIVFPLVQKINKALGVECWIDIDGIETAEQFEDVIIEAINKCKIVLFMLSDNSLKSKWTKREVYYAEGEGKRIVPIIVNGEKPHGWFKFHFGNIDHIDIQSEEQVVKLIRDLKMWLNIQDVPNPQDDKWSKMRTIFGISFGVLLCLMVGLFFVRQYHGLHIEDDNTACIPIDLGLASGTLWGDRNIGAKSPTDYGQLYAWGEINTKRDYSRKNYYGNNKKSKRNTLNGTNIDVAKVKLGGNWSMPSERQYEELVNECEWTWKSIDGHNGYEIRSKTNGNFIFLPACGRIDSLELVFPNEIGCYWTNELRGNDYAYQLFFGKNTHHVGNGPMHCGRSVRAVSVKNAAAKGVD